MIKKVLLVGTGVALGWVGHSLTKKTRDAAVIKAEESLKTTFAPENIGRNIGQASASVASETVRSFIGQIREEIPSWTRGGTYHNGSNTIVGEATDNVGK